MVEGKSVVAQDHELLCMIKELDMLKIVVPDKFVAGASLPSYLYPAGTWPLLSNTSGQKSQF